MPTGRKCNLKGGGALFLHKEHSARTAAGRAGLYRSRRPV